MKNLTEFGQALGLADEALEECERDLPTLDDSGDLALLRQVSALAGDCLHRSDNLFRQLRGRLLSARGGD